MFLHPNSGRQPRTMGSTYIVYRLLRNKRDINSTPSFHEVQEVSWKGTKMAVHIKSEIVFSRHNGDIVYINSHELKLCVQDLNKIKPANISEWTVKRFMTLLNYLIRY